MKFSKIILIGLITLSTQFTKAQQSLNPWDNWKLLIGEWVGEGDGQPGQGSGLFSFKTDLNDKVIIRRSHTEFPKTKTTPGAVHDDLMIIYLDYTGKPAKAIYFDNENHVLNYSISYIENTIVFLSEVVKNAPRFRLTYIPIDSNTINVKFEIAMPENIADFKTYIEGKSIRKI